MKVQDGFTALLGVWKMEENSFHSLRIPYIWSAISSEGYDSKYESPIQQISKVREILEELGWTTQPNNLLDHFIQVKSNYLSTL